MPITLAEMREGMQDKVTQNVIDTFIRHSEILEMLTFDDAVSAQGGSTLTYGYVQKKAPSKTGFRAINTEYTPSEATVEKKTVDLKIFGGAFQIDRVIKDAEGLYNNMALQMEEKIISAVGTFHDALINGDAATNADGFDGLDKFLVGQKSEYGTDEYIDLSTMDAVKENANLFYEKLLKLINSTGANAIIVNEDLKTKIQTVARILGYKTESEAAFGRVVTTIGENKVRIIDMGNVVTVDDEGNVIETPIIDKHERTIDEEAVDGLTDMYAVKFDVNNGFHGVTLTGSRLIKKFLPDFNSPGAVKTGEVEMVAAVALKNTNAAGVLRNIKVI